MNESTYTFHEKWRYTHDTVMTLYTPGAKMKAKNEREIWRKIYACFVFEMKKRREKFPRVK